MHIIALAARWHLKKRRFSIDAVFVPIEVLGRKKVQRITNKQASLQILLLVK